jgi:tRNA nucleotidyltransferase (CCA-adding enzyme)
LNPMFKKAVPILEKIEVAGYEAYFVGGAVRDLLLNRPISDVDIATSATPDEIKKIFPNTVDVGIEHGTVLVIYQGNGYEITTFRTESEYKDFRRPETVRFIRSLVEDLKRRDFTMNAMAMNKDGKIIDPFDGQKAIREKKIITVGKAEDRFREDALRMMRAVRFASQLAFALDTDCFNALIKMGPLLERIAVERKTAEFEKLLIGTNRIHAIDLLCRANLDRYLPELGKYERSLSELAKFPCGELELEEMWALLLYSLNVDINVVHRFLRSWKLPVKKIKKIHAIYSWTNFRLTNDWDRRSIYAAGKELLIHAERMVNAIHKHDIDRMIDRLVEQYDALPIHSRSELKITGSDLIEILKRPQGPWIKDCLSLIEKEILEERLANDDVQIREWVKTCNLK